MLQYKGYPCIIGIYKFTLPIEYIEYYLLKSCRPEIATISRRYIYKCLLMLSKQGRDFAITLYCVYN